MINFGQRAKELKAQRATQRALAEKILQETINEAVGKPFTTMLVEEIKEKATALIQSRVATDLMVIPDDYKNTPEAAANSEFHFKIVRGL